MASKRRPYAHLSDSIWREPWPTRAKLSVYNLIAYLHERWRTDRLDARTMFPLKIGWREAGLLFGGNSRAATLQGVLQVGCCITCSWVATDQHLEWSWPKWLEEQGLIPDERPTNAPPNPNPRPATIVQHKRKTPEPAEPVSAERARSKKPPKTYAPERLDDADREALRSWAEREQRWALPRLAELEAACLDHFRARGSPMASWLATVRNWVRRQPEFAKPTPGPVRGVPQMSSVSSITDEDRNSFREVVIR